MDDANDVLMMGFARALARYTLELELKGSERATGGRGGVRSGHARPSRPGGRESPAFRWTGPPEKARH